MRTLFPNRGKRQLADLATVITLLVLLGACASTQVASAPSQPVNFDGTWALNDALSEDQDAVVSEMVSNARARGRGGRRARGNAGGGAQGGARRGGGAALQPLLALLDSVAPDADQLLIEQSKDQLRMKHGERASQYHGFDSTRQVQLAGQDAERLTGWQDRDFLVKTSNDSGLTVTERYALSADGQRLTQSIEIDAERLPSAISITRVFDRT